MNGLYMRKPLSTDLSHYAIQPELQTMLSVFEQRQPNYLSDDEYIELINEDVLG